MEKKPVEDEGEAEEEVEDMDTDEEGDDGPNVIAKAEDLSDAE